MGDKLLEILLDMDEREAWLVVDGEETLLVSPDEESAVAYYEGFKKGTDSASLFMYRVKAQEL